MLAKILTDGALRGRADLERNATGSLAPTDPDRFDGHPDKICCSFQYPNVYYQNRAAAKPEQRNYEGWVCLLLDPVLASWEGTLFSPYNAAKNRGMHLSPGVDALRSCFAAKVGDRVRRPSHHPQAPTDLQAEIQVPGPIPLSYVRGMVLKDPTDATNQHLNLRYTGDLARTVDINWYTSPLLFDKERLRVAIHHGEVEAESRWLPPERTV